MFATLLQLAALVGFPVGGALGVTSSVGGGVVGGSVSLLFLGLAIEANRPAR